MAHGLAYCTGLDGHTRSYEAGDAGSLIAAGLGADISWMCHSFQKGLFVNSNLSVSHCSNEKQPCFSNGSASTVPASNYRQVKADTDAGKEKLRRVLVLVVPRGAYGWTHSKGTISFCLAPRARKRVGHVGSRYKHDQISVGLRAPIRAVTHYLSRSRACFALSKDYLQLRVSSSERFLNSAFLSSEHAKRAVDHANLVI